MSTRIMARRLGAVAVLLLCAMAMQTRAATITVTNTNDTGAGSLRQALAISNNGDTINFAVTGTITLTSGGLLIAKNITISVPARANSQLMATKRCLSSESFPAKLPRSPV